MQNRPETGPMEFEDDWRGIFIRGDNAAYYAMLLKNVLDSNSNNEDKMSFSKIQLIQLESLFNLLNSSNQFIEQEVQLLKPFKDCIK